MSYQEYKKVWTASLLGLGLICVILLIFFPPMFEVDCVNLENMSCGQMLNYYENSTNDYCKKLYSEQIDKCYGDLIKDQMALENKTEKQEEIPMWVVSSPIFVSS